MRLVFAALTALALVAACTPKASVPMEKESFQTQYNASREAYREKLRAWFGAAERDLVSYWGPPASVYEIAGDRHLTYLSAQPYPRRGWYGWHWVDEPCQLTFSIENGAVAQYRFQGLGCY